MAKELYSNLLQIKNLIISSTVPFLLLITAIILSTLNGCVDKKSSKSIQKRMEIVLG